MDPIAKSLYLTCLQFPHDDGIRLALADWLINHDQRTRGERVRYRTEQNNSRYRLTDHPDPEGLGRIVCEGWVKGKNGNWARHWPREGYEWRIFRDVELLFRYEFQIPEDNVSALEYPDFEVVPDRSKPA